jgi:sulfur carrier protein
MTDRAEMSVTVNGEPRRVPEGTTIRGLLDLIGVRGQAAVERNLELVPRARHAAERLSDGDALEVVQLVGGG